MDDIVVRLLRRADMVNLEFAFSNMSRTGEAGVGRLVVTNSMTPAFLTVRFPPQAVGEQAVTLANATTGVKGGWLAGPSQIVFRVPSGTSIPFTAAGLLAWTGLETAADRTSVECVWGLSFRPAPASVSWTHATQPVTSAAGVTGLWHTRLELPPPADGTPEAGARQPVPLSPAGATGRALPFLSSLTPGDRQSIASAMGQRPVLARAFVLSALGSTVDLAGDWRGLSGVGVTGYQHQAMLGRDTMVYVVERGYLMPFGFPAQLATRTERLLDFGLYQTLRLTVTLPEVTYPGAIGLPFQGRAFPFTRVRLNSPLSAAVYNGDEALLDVGFWIYGGGASDRRMRFSITGEDAKGQSVTFSTPMVFIRATRAHSGLRPAVAEYDGKARDIVVPAAGRMDLAPSASTDTTSVDVTALWIGALPATVDGQVLQQAGRLAAYPQLHSAEARVPALEAFPAHGTTAAVTAGPSGPVKLKPDKTYVEQGLAAASQVYATVVNPVNFAPPAAGSGGVAGLSLPVTGLSSTAGLIGGDLTTFRQGKFDPAKYFLAGGAPGFTPPKLLGFLSLPELIEGAGTGEPERAPRIVTEVLHRGGKKENPPEAVKTTIIWRPKVKVLTQGPLRTTDKTALDLRSTTLTRLGQNRPPESEVRGELRGFTLCFAGDILRIRFERLAFTAKAGAAPSLDVKVAEVAFGGELRFLDKLREYLPSPANGPRVKVDTNRIEAGYTLAIPSIGTGVFLLQNLALSATVTLPFGDEPVEATFALSSREHPFLVTVSLFGGGGFFSITVRSGEITALEAQLEFGAAAALNLGVASGSIAVTAGVYIRLENSAAKLRGFFRAVGELDILGIINISVEFYLALELREVEKGPPAPAGAKRQEAHGYASLTVRVRVAFFSQSVKLQVERSFGGGSDPTFAAAFPTQQPWRDRCAAFAAMEDT